MNGKHWSEENGKHVLRLAVGCERADVAVLFCSTDGVWTFELTLFHLARDFVEDLSVSAMQQEIERKLDECLAETIAFHEGLRGALREETDGN